MDDDRLRQAIARIELDLKMNMPRRALDAVNALWVMIGGEHRTNPEVEALRKRVMEVLRVKKEADK